MFLLKIFLVKVRFYFVFGKYENRTVWQWILGSFSAITQQFDLILIFFGRGRLFDVGYFSNFLEKIVDGRHDVSTLVNYLTAFLGVSDNIINIL